MVLQQLAWVALDADLFQDNSQCFLKDFISTAPIKRGPQWYMNERPFHRLTAFSCCFDPASGFRPLLAEFVNKKGRIVKQIRGWKYVNKKSSILW